VRTSSSPGTAPICFAGAGRSPVSMTNLVMPAARNRRTVRGASCRSGSMKTIAPTSEPSTLAHAITAPSNAARDSAALAHGWASDESRPAPTVTRLPSTVAVTPLPASSTTSVGMLSGSPSVAASSTMALASTCGETWVRRGREPQHLRRRPPRRDEHIRAARPTRGHRARLVQHQRGGPAQVFQCSPSLITTPRRDARDSPDTIATSAANSNGHGVATTRTATARSANPLISQANAATASANDRTRLRRDRRGGRRGRFPPRPAEPFAHCPRRCSHPPTLWRESPRPQRH
jgi:hypothetical protein